MVFIVLVLSLFFAFFSTAILSYISMAAGIGPWMEPTVALITLMVFMLIRMAVEKRSKSVALVTVAGSIGGIMATGVGFSFPAVYFLEPQLFTQMLQQPFYFIGLLSGLSLVAALFGFFIADTFENLLVVKEKLAFPVGELVHTIVSAASKQVRKAYELFAGLSLTSLFCLLQDGIVRLVRIPKQFTLFPATKVFGFISFPPFIIWLWPMVWAIGFLAGHLIAVPLAVGALSNILIIQPLNKLFFPGLQGPEFALAFCGGMILSGVLVSFTGMPKALWRVLKKMGHGAPVLSATQKKDWRSVDWFYWGMFFVTLLLLFLFLSYFGFSWLTQLYLLIFTFIWTYEAIYQGGRLGLATLGRFATFVMLPAMLLFRLSYLQIIMIATFVEVCAGVAVDVLFGRKLAVLESINRNKVRRFQLFGLVVSAFCLGAIFWVLFSYMQIGSPELFALKAKNRAALIEVETFNYMVLLLGIIFGFILKKIRVNPSLVLGGILMPLHLSLGLMIGGVGTLFVKNKESWYPFWSGVFVANSLWIVAQAFLKIIL